MQVAPRVLEQPKCLVRAGARGEDDLATWLVIWNVNM
jgi:hypothetical protein